jgi:molecular chaperone Hsp33
MSNANDQLLKYYLPELGVRIAVCYLSDVQTALLAQHNYPPQWQLGLCELACAAALLRSTVKLSGRLLLQRRDPKSGAQLFSECNHLGDVRGLAKYAPEHATLDLRQCEGILAITLEPDKGERYQGVVPVYAAQSNASSQLSDALEGYFAQSEQIPTVLVLGANTERSAGLIAQRMPQEGGQSSVDADGWNRALHLLRTLSADELLHCDAATVMQRLFHQEQVQALSAQSLRFHCPCSADRLKQVLMGLGAHEAMACVQADGYVTAHCEFCRAEYRFDAFEVGAWFSAGTGVARQH